MTTTAFLAVVMVIRRPWYIEYRDSSLSMVTALTMALVKVKVVLVLVAMLYSYQSW